MADGFGWLSPIVTPHLERVVRDERLQRELPRKSQEGRSGRHREEPRPPEAEPDSGREAMTSESPTHIDLRI